MIAEVGATVDAEHKDPTEQIAGAEEYEGKFIANRHHSFCEKRQYHHEIPTPHIGRHQGGQG